MDTWKQIENFSRYEVSNGGQVRNRETGKVLSPSITRGYPVVTLVGPSGQRKTARVHRLVAEAFIPNPEDHPNVLHGPEGSLVNRVENLRWGTQQENVWDSVYRDGTHPESRKTHCPKGHPYSPENTYRNPRGHRLCRKCQKGEDWVVTDHGLTSSYARGCRCEECTAAATRYSQRGIPDDDPRHGTYAGYRSGCRCSKCRRANADYEKLRRGRTGKLDSGQ